MLTAKQDTAARLVAVIVSGFLIVVLLVFTSCSGTYCPAAGKNMHTKNVQRAAHRAATFTGGN